MINGDFCDFLVFVIGNFDIWKKFNSFFKTFQRPKVTNIAFVYSPPPPHTLNYDLVQSVHLIKEGFQVPGDVQYETVMQ